MPKHILSYAANAVFVAIFVHDARVTRQIRTRYQEAVETNQRLRDYLIMSQNQVDYLVDIITKSDVDVDEFDLIALHNLTPKVEE